MRRARSVMLLMSAIIPIASAQAAHDPFWTPSAARRGTVVAFYRAGADGFPNRVEEMIFDGDRWLPLTKEDGWRLYIELQREQDPEAME